MRLTFGPFVFDSRLGLVTRDGAAVDLSPKALLLLEALIEARPAPVSKEVLYERLWPQTFVEAGNLHNLISEIRHALGGANRKIVRTVHGCGYAFDARDAVDASVPSSSFVLFIGDKRVELRSGENIIGRDPSAAIVIDSADVSRQHARLFVSDDHVVIEDLCSKNGTFMGGDRLSRPQVLHEGDEVFIGKVLVLLRKRGDVKPTITAF